MLQNEWSVVDHTGKQLGIGRLCYSHYNIHPLFVHGLDH